MMRKASPMECAEEVQAVAVASLGPLALYSDGDVAGGEVDDGAGDEEGGDLAGAAGEHGGVLAFDDVEAADAGADVDAETIGDLTGDLEAGVLHGFSCEAARAKWMKRPILRDSFFLHELERIEVL